MGREAHNHQAGADRAGTSAISQMGVLVGTTQRQCSGRYFLEQRGETLQR